MKKILILILTFTLFLVSAKAKAKKKYLALGDSITYGYGLDNRDENFATLFSKTQKLELTNEAISGDETSDLLNKLPNYNINDYDVITLCIGANDVLGEFLDDIENKSSLEIVEYIMNLDNNEDFQNRVNQKLEQFKTNLAKIMEIIKSGHAQVYLMNVYNPYHKFSLEALDKQADKFVKRINEVIEEYKKDTYFINLYKKFDSSKKELVNSQTTRTNYTMDPHPSPEGHKYISQLLSNEYELHNFETTYIILTIIFGILVVLLELFEILYTFKKFTVKIDKNVDMKPKIEAKENAKETSSRFIRS